jgi:hypothetical protein
MCCYWICQRKFFKKINNIKRIDEESQSCDNIDYQ